MQQFPLYAPFAVAYQSNNGLFDTGNYGPFYFVLDNEVIPEPGSLSLLAAAGLLLRRRRR